MSAKIKQLWILAVVLTLGSLACQGEDTPQITLNTDAFAAYEDESAEFPRLRFPDGSLSLNDRCPVRKVKLNRRMPPLYVNGRPIGFC